MGRHAPADRAPGNQGRHPGADTRHDRRHTRRRAKKNGGHNGWIAALAEWACRTYGWTRDETVFQVPASVVALFWRQSRYSDGNANVMHLSEIEEIDDRLEMARQKGQADHG